MSVTVRRVSSAVTFAGVTLADVISARGQVAADSGWPSCSVFVTAKPATGNEEDDLVLAIRIRALALAMQPAEETARPDRADAHRVRGPPGLVAPGLHAALRIELRF
jgi:hypothetical protein